MKDFFDLLQVDVDGELFTAISFSHNVNNGDIVRLNVWEKGTVFGTVIDVKVFSSAKDLAWEQRRGTVYIVKSIYNKGYVNDDSQNTYEGEEQENEQ